MSRWSQWVRPNSLERSFESRVGKRFVATLHFETDPGALAPVESPDLCGHSVCSKAEYRPN